MVALTDDRAKKIAKAIRLRPNNLPFSWDAVTELSKCADKPEGFTRQWLQANHRVRAAYDKKRGDLKKGEGNARPREAKSELEILRQRNALLREEIEERDRHLDHFCDVLLRMVRNAVDRGKMKREDLFMQLPPMVRRGRKSGNDHQPKERKSGFDLP